jgi:hypothetical protein
MVGTTPLRIVFCTKHDLPGAIILNRILPQLVGHQVIVMLSEKTRGPELVIPELSILKYLERDLPVGTIFPLVDSVKDNLVGKKLTFQGLSRKFEAPFLVVDDVNSAKWVGTLRDFNPDIIVSVRFSNVFKEEVIQIPRLGTFNIHPGALPHYAGLFPSFRAMLNQEQRIGATLHRVDRRIDAGPILGIGWTEMVLDRGLLWHVFKSYNAGLDLFVDILPRIRAGEAVEEVPQDESLRAYRSLPAAEDVRRFIAQGYQLFDPKSYSETLAEFLPPHMDIPLCC